MAQALASVMGFVSLLAIGLIVAIALATFYVLTRLRRPPRKTAAWAISKGAPSDPSELDSPLQFEEWSFCADHGPYRGEQFPVWDIAGADPAGPTMIFSSGWGDSRIGALPRVAALSAYCSRLIAWDAPGLGDAPGLCAMGVHEPALLRTLADRVIPDAQTGILLYGWSLGAGVSIAAGALPGEQIHGIVAEAPYRLPWTPAFRVLEANGLPWRINGPIAFALLGARLGVGTSWRGFDRRQHSAALDSPLLVIHGDEDVTCPLEDAAAIAESASQGRFEVIRGAGHNDLWTDAQFARQCCEHTLAFLRQVTGSPGASV